MFDVRLIGTASVEVATRRVEDRQPRRVVEIDGEGPFPALEWIVAHELPRGVRFVNDKGRVPGAALHRINHRPRRALDIRITHRGLHAGRKVRQIHVAILRVNFQIHTARVVPLAGIAEDAEILNVID